MSSSQPSTSSNKRKRSTNGRYELRYSRDGDRFVAAELIHDHLQEAMLHAEELLDIVRDMRSSYMTLDPEHNVPEGPNPETYMQMYVFALAMDKQVNEEWKRFTDTWDVVDDRDDEVSATPTASDDDDDKKPETDEAFNKRRNAARRELGLPVVPE